jgi:hypothetical protein
MESTYIIRNQVGLSLLCPRLFGVNRLDEAKIFNQKRGMPHYSHKELAEDLLRMVGSKKDL